MTGRDTMQVYHVENGPSNISSSRDHVVGDGDRQRLHLFISRQLNTSNEHQTRTKPMNEHLSVVHCLSAGGGGWIFFVYDTLLAAGVFSFLRVLVL